MTNEEDIINFLILNNAMELAGLDSETGEPLYIFTNKLKDVMPELYAEHIKNVNSGIMRLWEKGFVDIDLMSDDPIVTLTEKALIEQEIGSLSKEDAFAINELKRVLRLPEL